MIRKIKNVCVKINLPYASTSDINKISGNITDCHLANIKQIFLVFLFNIRNYSLEVINIRKAELNIILPKVNNFNIKQKRHGIFGLLYATNTKLDLGR